MPKAQVVVFVADDGAVILYPSMDIWQVEKQGVLVSLDGEVFSRRQVVVNDSRGRIDNHQLAYADGVEIRQYIERNGDTLKCEGKLYQRCPSRHYRLRRHEGEIVGVTITKTS